MLFYIFKSITRFQRNIYDSYDVHTRIIGFLVPLNYILRKVIPIKVYIAVIKCSFKKYNIL